LKAERIVTLELPPPAHMPCSECGASVARGDEEAHRCEPERRLDYVMFELRAEVESFDHGLGAYLDSSHGRFEQWDAARRRAGPGTS
jgi:hypothetical protein